MICKKIYNFFCPWKKEIEDLKKQIAFLEGTTKELLHEKHEMIVEDRGRLEALELYVQRLFSEKHEMIMEDRGRLEALELYVQRLFSEKHEMILEDRKEILELVRRDLLQYYANQNEKETELEYLKHNPIQMYPYEWTKEYDSVPIEICQDEEGDFYIYHKAKKLFFPRTFTKEHVEQYYRFLLMEQDKRSPHYYDLEKNIDCDVAFVDVGAAEGMISLDVIEKVKKVYILECDVEWIGALKKTFLPYQDKVEIIDKFAGNKNSDKETTLSKVCVEKMPYIIKIDVEGHELEVLEGMQGIYLMKKSCIAICCYHHQDDERQITEFFDKEAMNYEFASGYILSTWGGYKEPYFRRGICRVYCDNDRFMVQGDYLGE